MNKKEREEKRERYNDVQEQRSYHKESIRHLERSVELCNKEIIRLKRTIKDKQQVRIKPEVLGSSDPLLGKTVRVDHAVLESDDTVGYVLRYITMPKGYMTKEVRRHIDGKRVFYRNELLTWWPTKKTRY